MNKHKILAISTIVSAVPQMFTFGIGLFPYWLFAIMGFGLDDPNPTPISGRMQYIVLGLVIFSWLLTCIIFAFRSAMKEFSITGKGSMDKFHIGVLVANVITTVVLVITLNFG